MKENKKFRKDDLSSVDSSKRVYRMYKKKKNWVVAPVLFALLAPTMIAGPGAVIANAVENPATETTVTDEHLDQNIADAKVKMESQAMAELFRADVMQKLEQNPLDLKNKVLNSKTQAEFDEHYVAIHNELFKAIKIANQIDMENAIRKFSELSGKTDKYGDVLSKAESLWNKDDKLKVPEVSDLTNIDQKVNTYKDDVQKYYVDEFDDDLADLATLVDMLNNFESVKKDKIKQINNWESVTKKYDKDLSYLSVIADDSINNINNLKVGNNETELTEVFNALDKLVKRVEVAYNVAIADGETQILLDKLADHDMDNDKYPIYGTVEKQQKDAKTYLDNSESLDTVKDIVKFVTSEQFKQDVQNAIDNKDNINDLDQEQKTLIDDMDAFFKAATDKNEYKEEPSKDPVKIDLTDAQYKELDAKIASLKKQVNKIETQKDLDAVNFDWSATKAKYIALSDANSDLELDKLKENYKNMLGDSDNNITSPLEYLDAEVRGEYIERIQNATTKEQLASIMDEAFKEAIKEEKAVKTKRDSAKKAIRKLAFDDAYTFKDELEYFGGEDITEKNLLNHIDGLTSVSEIDTLVERAEFARDRELALESILDLPIQLTAVAKDDLAKAKNDTELKRAVSASIVKGMTDYVANPNDELPSIKNNLKNAIKRLPYLSGEQIKRAEKALDKADNKDDAKNIWKQYAEMNTANQKESLTQETLQDNKDLARRYINQLPFVKDKVRNALLSEVDKATTLTDLFGQEHDFTNYNGDTEAFKALEVLGEDGNSAIHKANREKAYAQAIVEEKQNAAKAIDKLGHLTLKEQNDYKAQINDATTKEQIENILHDATVKHNVRLLEKSNKDDAKKLAESFIEAEKEANHLNSSQAKGYIKRIKDAKDVKEIVSIYKEAVKVSDKNNDDKLIVGIEKDIKAQLFVEAQKKIDQLRDDKTRNKYQAMLDDAVKLVEVKAEAAKTIDSLNSLSKKEKEAAKDKVNNMTSVKDVENFVEDLLVKEDAVLAKAIEALIKAEKFEEAKKEINNLRSQTEKDRLTAMLEEAMNVLPRLQYTAHVRNKGWMKVGNIKPTDEKVTTIGTTGEALPMEAIVVSLNDVNLKKNGIQYRAHVRNIGWQEWTNSGYVAGTTGKALSIETLQFKLTGEVAKKYDIEYRAHVRNKGWQKWVKNGAKSGTTGKALPIEALQIKLVKKDVAK